MMCRFPGRSPRSPGSARALEELAQLLVATGELTPADLRRLPASS